MSHILEAHGIHKYFDQHHVLDDVSLDVPASTIYGLLGPNGAGKTTLIRILTQITAPDEGSILFQGKPLSTAHRPNMGYLPEERGLYRRMRVWDQAMYLTRLKGLDQSSASRVLHDWFERLNMLDWRTKRVQELSKGMQQKLQFVITVAHDPDLLILDEPFSGFDPVNTEEIKSQILRLKEEGKTIIFSTHNMASVEELCDHITLIHRGKSILSGATNTVRKSYKKNMFRIEFKGSKVAFANGLGHAFELSSLDEREDSATALVQSFGGATSQALLSGLAPVVEIVRFEEMLPSMNDIFLEQVAEHQPENPTYAP